MSDNILKDTGERDSLIESAVESVLNTAVVGSARMTGGEVNELLIPGVTASLDHKTPVSRGGSNEITNLQWVTTRINSMKSDLTHEEFVALCRVIGQLR